MRGSSTRPAVDQVQFSPFHFRRRLLDYCRGEGIVFEAYSPLARGKGPADPTITEVARVSTARPPRSCFAGRFSTKPS
jgi:diketogulonate reductase-like aldo/keto reductase